MERGRSRVLDYECLSLITLYFFVKVTGAESWAKGWLEAVNVRRKTRIFSIDGNPVLRMQSCDTTATRDYSPTFMSLSYGDICGHLQLLATCVVRSTKVKVPYTTDKPCDFSTRTGHNMLLDSESRASRLAKLHLLLQV